MKLVRTHESIQNERLLKGSDKPRTKPLKGSERSLQLKGSNDVDRHSINSAGMSGMGTGTGAMSGAMSGISGANRMSGMDGMSGWTDGLSTREIARRKNTASFNKKLLLLAYIVMVLSAIIFSALAVLIQYGDNFGYPSGELLMFRGIEQIIILILAVTCSKEYPAIRENWNQLSKEGLFWLAMRGFSGSCAGLGYFLAICILPIGDAIATFSIYPLVCCFFGWLILKEEIKLIHFVLVLVSIVGVVLLAQPSFLSVVFDEINKHASGNQNVNSDYYVIPLIGAVWAGLAFVSMRKSKGTHIKLLVGSYSIFSCVSGALSTIIYHYLGAFDNHVLFKFVGFSTWHDIKQWLLLISMGIVGYFAQTTMTYSAQKLPAGVSSFIRSSDIIWSYLFGVIFFNQIPSLATIIGAILILGCIAGVCVVKYLKTKNKK